METGSFRHLSKFIGQKQIGLGWLAGVSFMDNDRAVTTDWHRHRTTEMIFCLRGETSYEFRGRPAVTLHAGSWVVIPATVEHRVSDALDGPGKRIGLNLNERMAARRRYAVFSPADYARFRARLEQGAYVAKPVGELRHAVAELERMADEPQLTSELRGYVRILCCSILYRATLPPAAKPAPVTKIMDEAVRWLNQHLAEDVSVDRLVAFMGYSRARLFSLFKAHVGHAPNDYLQRLRIQKAKSLLSRGALGEKAVAAACGFKSAGYFIRAFKRQTGLTPLAYRAKFRPGA